MAPRNLAIAVGCLVALIIGVLLVTSGHALVEETRNIDGRTVTTTIEG